MSERPLTAADLAEALDCFWNAAIGHSRENGSNPVASVAVGIAAVATRLREIDEKHSDEEESSAAPSPSQAPEKWPVLLNNRGFEMVMREPAKAFMSQSSVIGNYKDSFDRPGSSAIWIGGDHLNREDVAELVARLQSWLETGSFKVGCS